MLADIEYCEENKFINHTTRILESVENKHGMLE